MSALIEMATEADAQLVRLQALQKALAFAGQPAAPSSADGACKALVGNVIDEGRCGDVDLSGVTAVAIIDWPRAIHDGGGRAVFVVPPETTAGKDIKEFFHGWNHGYTGPNADGIYPLLRPATE